VRAEGSVEQWLMRLLQEAQRSLHSIIRLASQAIHNSEFNLLEFLAAFPSQVNITYTCRRVLKEFEITYKLNEKIKFKRIWTISNNLREKGRYYGVD